MITETRRAPRMPVPELVPVRDMMTDGVIGRLSNISESGMLLIASGPLQDDALYQLQFTIPDGRGGQHQIDAGVHLLWREPAHAPEQSWAGFRFLTMDKAQREQLVHWIESNLPKA
ncbi:MAG: PilZ domain-containing protein [Stenotrophomonas sp.]|jgi:c-di-GMP-binding flagellar brake protein YcgR|uniref:PilZ domain-containing protein n=1 Tax=unclassified Stenotrophomonas TaxID=196198 RepID=UPI00177DD67E|nr:PilZ domain-containing protein [Stenotrophomonas sp. STM01]MBD9536498.1 PilZ domain-containing protein [Stenotrophomonas sp. STM01]